jgi:hypothetical protein
MLALWVYVCLEGGGVSVACDVVSWTDVSWQCWLMGVCMRVPVGVSVYCKIMSNNTHCYDCFVSFFLVYQCMIVFVYTWNSLMLITRPSLLLSSTPCDAFVLLLSASVRSQTGSWVLNCFFPTNGRRIFKMSFSKTLDTMGKRLMGKEWVPLF